MMDLVRWARPNTRPVLYVDDGAGYVDGMPPDLYPGKIIQVNREVRSVSIGYKISRGHRFVSHAPMIMGGR